MKIKKKIDDFTLAKERKLLQQQMKWLSEESSKGNWEMLPEQTEAMDRTYEILMADEELRFTRFIFITRFNLLISLMILLNKLFRRMI